MNIAPCLDRSLWVIRQFRIACTALLVCWAGHAGAQALHLAHQFGRDSLPDRSAQKFVQLVQEKSGGKLRIAVHPAASLGDEREQLSLLKKGKLDFAVTGDLVISSISERYLVVSLPFIYRDVSHAMAVYDGPIGNEIRNELLTLGLRALSWHHVGTRLLTANKPVRNLADLKDLQLRLPQDGAWMESWRALGTHPRHVSFKDLPTALKLGTVQAQENPPNFIRNHKLYEYQKYLILTNHIPQRQFIFAGSASWARLNAAQRNLITEAAREASAWTSRTAQQEHQADLDWLQQQAGMVVVPFDQAGVMARIAPVPQKLAGEAGTAIYQQIMKAGQ